MTSKIFNGEIPHKDFISIRPIGSSLIALYAYIPLFESFQLLITRIFFLIEMSLIVWFWVQIIQRFYELPKQWYVLFALIVSSLLLNIHDFPFLHWHTVDGILFCSIALFIRTNIKNDSYTISVFLTYLFLGLSILCKQSFTPFAFVTIIFFKDFKSIWSYFGLLLLPAIYVGWISSYGGFFDVVLQLTAQSKILGVGFKRYLLDLWWLVGLFIGLGIVLVQMKRSSKFQSIVMNIVFISLLIFVLFDLFIGNNLSKSSVVIFGISCSFIIFKLIRKEYSTSLLLLSTLLAWCSALSIGYSFPSLLCGVMLLLLFFEMKVFSNKQMEVNWTFIFVSMVSFLLIIAGFTYSRYSKIYREEAIPKLQFLLGQVLTNGKGIYTSSNTYSLLKDIDFIQKKFESNRIIFAPDLAGIYSDRNNPNPTLSTWARDLELPNKALQIRFEQQLESLMLKSSLIAVSKYSIESIAYSFTTLNVDSSDSPIVRYAKNHCQIVDSTRFFYIYKK